MTCKDTNEEEEDVKNDAAANELSSSEDNTDDRDEDIVDTATNRFVARGSAKYGRRRVVAQEGESSAMEQSLDYTPNQTLRCRKLGHSAVAMTRVLCQKSFLAIVVAHMTHNYGYYVTLMWLPAYFTSLGEWLQITSRLHGTACFHNCIPIVRG